MHFYLLYIFMDSLPYELMNFIRRMTYNPQSINMLNQIKVRHILKKQLYDIYTPIYSHELENDTKAIENWIENDISISIQCSIDQASMDGNVDHYYDILSRNIIFNTNEKIDKFLHGSSALVDSKTTINIYLGLLNIADINHLKKYINKIYNVVL